MPAFAFALGATVPHLVFLVALVPVVEGGFRLDFFDLAEVTFSSWTVPLPLQFAGAVAKLDTVLLLLFFTAAMPMLLVPLTSRRVTPEMMTLRLLKLKMLAK